MKAMVLAAGVGSRLDPLTGIVPKPLVPVANLPVVEHIVCLLKQHGFDQIVANLHYMPEKLQEHFKDGGVCNTTIEMRQEEKLSGDAGGVRFCRDFLDGDTFIVLMGDLLTDADLTSIVKQHKAKGAIATIGLKRVDDVSQFGVALLDQDGFIKGFQEKPSAEEALSDLASTGIYILEPEVFEHIPATGDYFFGRQLFPTLVKMGKPVLGVEIGAYWSDVGTIEQYFKSNFDLLEERMKSNLPGYKKVVYGYHNIFVGKNAKVSPTARIDGNLMLGKDSVIEDGVTISGNVIVGDNCVVGKNSKLSDVIIWSDCSVESDSELASAIVSSAGVTQVEYQRKNPHARRYSGQVKKSGTPQLATLP